MHLVRLFSHLAVLALCAGCSNTSAISYVGALRPLAGTCDAGNRATLQRHRETVQFTPQDGVVMLEGTVTPAGSINASAETTGMDRKPYHMLFTGSLRNGTISGTYITPRCRYAVTLAPVPE